MMQQVQKQLEFDDNQSGAPHVKSIQDDHQLSIPIVQVNQNSPLSELHSSIVAVTGLKAHQQSIAPQVRQ
jgi:hypothetical protein